MDRLEKTAKCGGQTTHFTNTTQIQHQGNRKTWYINAYKGIYIPTTGIL